MSRAPRVDPDRISERCASLGLVHAAECLGELLEEAARDDLKLPAAGASGPSSRIPEEVAA